MAQERRHWEIEFEKNTEDGKFDEQIFCTQVLKAIGSANPKKQRNDEIGKANYKYWRDGKQKTEDDLFVLKFAKIVINRVFANIDTAIPKLTANVPDPTVLNTDNTVREKIQGMLRDDYEVNQKMQQVMQEMLLNWYLFRIGVLKYRWEYDDDKMYTYAVLPEKVWFDDKATKLRNCEWVIEEMEDSVAEIAFKFNKIKELEVFFPKLKGKTKYYEVWGEKGAKVGWCIPERSIVLDVMDNPNYDYGTKAPLPLAEGKNIHRRPKFPYLALQVFHRGAEWGMYDDTSFIEQVSSIVEAITTVERQAVQIIDGTKRVWAISGEAMSREDAQKLVNVTGDYLAYYDKAIPPGGLSIPMAGAFQMPILQYIQHLLSEIDNIMGVHAITRGEAERIKETLGAKRAQEQMDISRFDKIVRNMEQVMEDWYTADIQMRKVYATSSAVFTVKENKMELRKEEIPEEVLVLVKKGSTLPTDDKTRMDMAVALAKMDMIDPHTLFEELSYGKEEERVRALYQWKVLTGKINPQALALTQGQSPQGTPPQGQNLPSQGAGGTIQSGQPSDPRIEQLDRLKAILSDPRVTQMPPEQKQQVLMQVKQMAAAVSEARK